MGSRAGREPEEGGGGPRTPPSIQDQVTQKYFGLALDEKLPQNFPSLSAPVNHFPQKICVFISIFHTLTFYVFFLVFCSMDSTHRTRALGSAVTRPPCRVLAAAYYWGAIIGGGNDSVPLIWDVIIGGGTDSVLQILGRDYWRRDGPGPTTLGTLLSWEGWTASHQPWDVIIRGGVDSVPLPMGQ